MALTKAKASNILLTTPAASSNDTTPATTEYVTTAVANLIDNAPANLNTLNELAAAMADNASFFSTVLPLSGGTMTGALVATTATFAGGAANNNDDANILTLNASEHARLLVDTSSTGGHRATLALESNGNETTLSTTGSASFLNVDTGNLTVDVAGDIILDAAGNDVIFKDAGTTFGQITNDSGNMIIYNAGSQMLKGVSLGSNAQFMGNVGIKVPSLLAFRTNSNEGAIQIGKRGVIYADTGITTQIGNNTYITSANQRVAIENDHGSFYEQYQGKHYFYTTTQAETPGTLQTFVPQMMMLQNGNVGIGNSSPTHELDILGGNLSTLRHNSLRIMSNTEGTGGETNIMHNVKYNSGYKYVVADEAARIQFINGKTTISRAVAGSAGAAATWLDTAIFDASGNLSMNAPANLDVGGTGSGIAFMATNQIRVGGNDGTNMYTGYQLMLDRMNTPGEGPNLVLSRNGYFKAAIGGLQGSSGNATSAEGNLAFYTATTSAFNERMRLTSTGELILKTTTAAPTNSASLSGPLTFQGFGWDSNYGSKPIRAKLVHSASYGDHGSGATQGALVFYMQGAGGLDSSPDTLQEGMRLDAGGAYHTGHPNLGINTSNIFNTLHVRGDIGQEAENLISVSGGGSTSYIDLYKVHGNYIRGSGRLRAMGMENNLNVGYVEYMYAYSRHSNGTYYINIKLIDEAYVNNTYGRPRFYLTNASGYNTGGQRQVTNQTANSTNVNILRVSMSNQANAYGTFQFAVEPFHWHQ